MSKLLIIEASIKNANLWSVYRGNEGVIYSPRSMRESFRMIRNIRANANVDLLDFRAMEYTMLDDTGKYNPDKGLGDVDTQRQELNQFNLKYGSDNDI